MGHHRQVNQGGTLYSSKDDPHHSEACQDISLPHSCLHGVPKTIISDRGTQFVSRFWYHLQQALGTQLAFSTTYHPQTDGQTERVNQVLEDMLRACVLTYGTIWEESLPYAEFAYNNSYQASLQMAPFEALYGRRCRTPLNWSETGDSASLDQTCSEKPRRKSS